VGIVFFIFTTVIYAQKVSASQDAKDYGDAIVVASISDARTLIPILASDSSSSDVCNMIFNGLVKYDKNINLVGDLAENWEIKEGGLVIIFHLKKNVLWHDGYPFSAYDAEFTYQKLIDPKVRTPYSVDFERVKSFEVLDNYTVKVTYKEPFAPGLSSWGMPVLPKHILENQDLNNSEFSRHPIGTGPYKFKSWKTQEKIELVSNQDYFENYVSAGVIQRRPYIDRYIFRIIPDEATIFLELETEGLDFAGLSPLQYKRQTDNDFFKQNYKKFRLPSFSYTYLGYNLKNPKFQDPRVRQALNYAVDKNEIIKIVLLGLGEVATGPFVPQSWAYNKEVAAISFDPAKAVELLREAGWKERDKDGWLVQGKERFEFTIITNQGNDERLKVCQIIQRRLASIGIKIKIKVVEWSVFLSEFINKRNFDAVLLGWSLPREPDNYDIWHSSKTKEGEFNFIGYKNGQVDDLLLEARRTFDQEARQKYYQEIQRIIYHEQPYMFLYTTDSLSILHKRFKGIEPAPIGIGYNFIDWWVPKQEQKYEIMQK
jgi:peptide/nickel transport system substrate-binding protein